MARSSARSPTGASAGSPNLGTPLRGGAGLFALGVSLGVILVAGFVLYSARGVLGEWLDDTLPELGAQQAAMPAIEVAGPDTFAPAPPPPPKPTYDELATTLLPLADAVLTLAEEGRNELPEFVDLSSEDEIRARQMSNRWRAWGRIWRNRVGVIERQLPPAEDCADYDDLAVVATVLNEAFAFLHAVPTATDIPIAMARLDEAAGLATLVQPRVAPAVEPTVDDDQS